MRENISHNTLTIVIKECNWEYPFGFFIKNKMNEIVFENDILYKSKKECVDAANYRAKEIEQERKR